MEDKIYLKVGDIIKNDIELIISNRDSSENEITIDINTDDNSNMDGISLDEYEIEQIRDCLSKRLEEIKANKPKLKFTVNTVMETTDREIEELIKSVYGFSYECVPMEEWGNYEEHSFEVLNHKNRQDYQQLTKDDLKTLENFKTTGETTYRMLYLLLSDMCDRGYLEEGTYLIDCSW